MVYNSPSTIIQLYRGDQFYLSRKPEYPNKSPTCSKSLYHILLCRVHPAMSGIRTHNFSHVNVHKFVCKTGLNLDI